MPDQLTKPASSAQRRAPRTAAPPPSPKPAAPRVDAEWDTDNSTRLIFYAMMGLIVLGLIVMTFEFALM